MLQRDGMMALINGKYIALAVVTALAGMRIGAFALAVSITALIFKVGLEVFCEVTKPDAIMIDRSER